MNFTGLSLDQAPPIDIPFRYFLVAPLFAILSALLFLVDGFENIDRFSIYTIASIHLITIGFFGFVMLGALTQMLPVIANATIKNVRFIAGTSHILMVIGLFLMVYSLINQNDFFMKVSYVSLGSGFLMMVTSILNSIKDIENLTPTIKAMRIALIFAISVVFIGIFLFYEYSVYSLSSIHINLANIHATIAIFGFAIILIIGVSFQVLPMFYVAPNFDDFIEKKLVYFLFYALIVFVISALFFLDYVFIIKIFLVLYLTYFAINVLLVLSKRKRKIKDITIYYWQSGSILLILGLLLWLVDEFTDTNLILIVSVLIGSFIISIMQGMLYKIIPFLVWFHLNSKGYMNILTMNEMINKKLSYIQFILFLLSLFLFIFSFVVASIFYISIFLFISSMILFEYNIVSAVLIYKNKLKEKPDFDMSQFSN